jgi:CheY-like chemotaxis protein
VRYIVEMHGGTVDAESAGEDRGATFRVVLPLRDEKERPSSPGARRPPEDQRASVEPVSIAGLNVLVVDDELDARELLTTILEAHGATAHAAASAADARAALERLTPDVLLSDIGMPGEDGLSFIRHLRAQGSTLPAIALTAYASAEDTKRALLAGFQSHLAKPVEAGALTAVIAGLAVQRSRSE